MVIALLVAGINTHAEEVVDNSVKYGEKYSCTITTADEKTYSLDLEWNSEASKFSKTPAWEEKLTYQLFENEKSVDKMSFADKGQNRARAVLTFLTDKFVFSGTESFQSVNASSTYYADIEISQNYNDKGQRVLSVVKFKTSYWYEKYVLKKMKEIELVIASSTCSVNAGNIQ